MSEDTKFVQGAAKLSQRIATIRDRLALPVMVEQIGKRLLERTWDRFDKQVDPDGVKWKKLEDSTLERRARAGITSNEILKRSRRLRESIKIIKGGAGSTFFNTGAGLRIGIDPSATGTRGESMAAYAAVMQRGDNKHGTKPRRFLGIGALDVKSVDSLLRRAGDNAVEE
jgi:hypothetical protein